MSEDAMTDTEKLDAEIVRLRDEIERLHEDLSRANAEAARQRALADFAEHQNAALREAVARVRAVHSPDIDAPCDYCAPGGIGPCPTLTALEASA